MQNDPDKEAVSWLRQAADDLKYARILLREGGFALTCFVSQQVAEKSLKGFLYSRGEELIKTHSVIELGRWCAKYEKKFDPLTEKAKILDGYYIPTRYPNGLPGGAPYEAFTRGQAAGAVQLAAQVLRACRSGR
ncbi:MAG: HEPN domain-containing protein [Nitrospirae bacterium]|nr:HEPN domain-containing protein [Nitrospirota bacterium]